MDEKKLAEMFGKMLVEKAEDEWLRVRFEVNKESVWYKREMERRKREESGRGV